MAKRLVCISGSYRAGGIIEQAVGVLAAEGEGRGWVVERVRLAEQRIEFCVNCRACMQEPGEATGECWLEDDVKGVLAKVEASDALVLASPVNVYDVTAVTRAFLERTSGVAYWPWGQAGPSWRRKGMVRRSVLISSTAMPAVMAWWATRSMTSLKHLSRSLSAKPVDRVYLGMSAMARDQRLSERSVRRLRASAGRLLG